MPLNPIDQAHALQIQAGILGRKTGHGFEDSVTKEINSIRYPLAITDLGQSHVLTGDPAMLLMNYVAGRLGITGVTAATAISTGALATSEEGKRWLSINGANISRCKSDIVLTLARGNRYTTIGISTKQCNNRQPTNAQLYFTTARGFVKLLRDHSVVVSDCTLNALRQFCGDSGFRPADVPAAMINRKTDPRRFFWEEIDPIGRKEWERIFTDEQAKISQLLFQKAYIEDDIVPEYLLHKTKRSDSWNKTEVAIFAINELVALSVAYQGFVTRPYCVRKGSYRDPKGVIHIAPRFGIIQMQRAGQAQHPE